MELINKELQRAIFKSNSFEAEAKTTETEEYVIRVKINDDIHANYVYLNESERDSDIKQIEKYIREMEGLMFM